MANHLAKQEVHRTNEFVVRIWVSQFFFNPSVVYFYLGFLVVKVCFAKFVFPLLSCFFLGDGLCFSAWFVFLLLSAFACGYGFCADVSLLVKMLSFSFFSLPWVWRLYDVGVLLFYLVFLVVAILIFLKHLVLPNNSIIFQLQSGFFIYLSIF